MRSNHHFKWKRLCACLLSAVLLLGNVALPVRAESDPLKPEDLTYEDGNIILHKQAERISSDEWQINVSASIKDEPVEPPKLEVTFVLDLSGSMNACADVAQHRPFGYSFHYHGIGCSLICESTDSSHTHVDACYDCGMPQQQHYDNKKCEYWYDGNTADKYYFTSRYAVATQVLNKMTNALPNGTRIGRVIFNSNNNAMPAIVSSFDGLQPTGDTYMMAGVDLALDTTRADACFSTDPSTKKILIIVTDGAASDGLYSSESLTNFTDPNGIGGIVYTVGFNHDDPNLTSMAANGGTYSQASNPAELEQIFDGITYELTAMLVDPMGNSVGFETNSAEQPSTSVGGSLTFDSSSKTLYWNPSSSLDIANSTIEYSYTVKLVGSDANMAAGIHSDVALNNPTSLLYGIDGSEMRSAAFPIPKATYAVSSLQVQWQCGGTDLKTPSAVESVICDYPGAAFATDYTAAEPSITVGDKTYYYTGTVITKNGTAADAVTIEDAAAFVVTHQYTEEVRYKVTYSYEGTVPEGAPDPSAFDQFGLKTGDTVTLAADPALEGYAFSGWEAVTGSISGDGTVRITDADVTLVGRWTKLNGYRIFANYFTATDGGAPVRDNDAPVLLAEDLKATEDSVKADLSGFFTYEGADYGSVTAEGPAQLDGKLLTLVPSDPAAEITLTFLREIRNPYTVTVRYVDDCDDVLLPTESVSLLSGDDYDVTAKALPTVRTEDGRVFDFVSDNGAAYEGTVTDHDIEIIRTYVERGTATVTVLYVNEAGDELMTSSNSGDVYVGEPYDVSDAERFTTIVAEDGKVYVFDRDGGAAYTGVMPDSDFTITRVYREKDKATATVRFVDEDGSELNESVSQTDYVDNSYDLYTESNIQTITTDTGRLYDFVSDGDAVYTGKIPAGGIVINRVYRERAKAPATVYFLTESDVPLCDPMVERFYVNTPYDVSEAEKTVSITRDGKLYDFIRDSSTPYTGTMDADGIEIDRYYEERAMATVTVRFEDERGNELREPMTQTVYWGTEYNISEAKAILYLTTADAMLYNFVRDGGAVYVGTMPEDGLTFIRVYEEEKKAIATVRFMDEDGNALTDPLTDTVYVTFPYDVTEAEAVTTIETADGRIYDYVEDNGEEYSGIMAANGIDIFRYYKERAKATVTVHYVDEEGTRLTDSYASIPIYLGQDYDVSDAILDTVTTEDGKLYDFVRDEGGAYLGTVEGDVTIYRVYKEREKATVTVRFEDEAGNALRESMSETVYRNTAYDVLEAWYIDTITKDGKIYDVKPDSYDLYSGTLTEDKTIVRVYRERAKAPLSVTFVDTDNYFLRDPIFEDVYYYTEYDVREVEEIVSITTADGRIFDFIDDGDAAYTGTMTPQGYGIIRVYEERAKAAVTVRYVDENGDPLQDDFVSEQVYVDTGYEVAEEQRLTTLTKDSKLYTFVTDGGASYSGTMKEGGIEIVRVYREQGKEVVTVHYVDTEGNQLIEDMTSNPVYVGKTYNVAASLDFVSFIKDGIYYVFDSDGGAAYTGTMVEGGIEITRVYREQDKRPVTVRFTDEDGKELQADAVYGPFYVGRSYDASGAQDILTVTAEDGSIYDFVSDADAAYTGVMTEDGAVITRVYRERAKATVTVHFVDEAGNALQADTVFGPAYVGSEFDVSEAEAVTAITKDGKLYDFVSDEAAAYTGTLTENGTEITRVYKERAKATVTVHYVDKDGNKLLADTVESVYVDTAYDVTGAKLQSFTKDGKAYEFVGDADAAYTGTMTADGVEITRVYKLKPAGGSSTQTPVTGDRGFGLWAVILMMSASMLPMLVFGKRRPRRN